MKERSRACNNEPRLRPCGYGRCIVEHPFATLKYRIFGTRDSCCGDSRSTNRDRAWRPMAYNLKRMINVLGGHKLAAALAG